jgi:hypothetical protein
MKRAAKAKGKKLPVSVGSESQAASAMTEGHIPKKSLLRNSKIGSLKHSGKDLMRWYM